MSDRELGYNKAALYWAGMTFFPDAATTASETDNATYAQGPTIQAEADNLGNPAALATVMSLCDQLQRSAQHLSRSLERIGENLVTLAENFERTDHGVQTNFQQQLKTLQHEYPDLNPRGQVPTPRDPYHYNPQGPVDQGDD